MVLKSAEEVYERQNIQNFKEVYLNPLKENENNTLFKLKIEKNKDPKKNKYVEVTVKEFADHLEALGTKLIDLGLKDKRIGLAANNRYEWPVAYFAVSAGTGTIVPIDSMLPEEEFVSSLDRVEIDTVFFGDKHVEFVKNILKNDTSKTVKNFIFLDKLFDEKYKYDINEIKNLSEKVGRNVYVLSELIEEGKVLLESGNREFLDAEIDVDKVTILMYTSATTSKSKIVELTQRNICSNLADITTMFEINEDDVFLSFLPIHHSFESTVGCLFPISQGATITYADSLRTIGDNLKEYDVTAIISVPALIEIMYQRIRAAIKKQGKENKVKLAIMASNTLRKFGIDKRKDFFGEIFEQIGKNLRLVVIGAAALDPVVHKYFHELGLEIYQGYGLTETSPVLAAGHAANNKYGSVGKVFPSVQIKIVDPDENGIGEIYATGPNISKGYYQNDEANADTYENGWIKTGDLGYKDDEDFLYITGRIKNVIVLKNGKNIFADESEQLVNRIEGVVECMVYGWNSEDQSDPKISAKIVYDKEHEIFEGKTKEEIRDYIWDEIKKINRKQPSYKYIKDIIVTDEELIKTTTRKVKRYEEMKKIQEYKENAN